jgi:hypothetical protein
LSKPNEQFKYTYNYGTINDGIFIDDKPWLLQTEEKTVKISIGVSETAIDSIYRIQCKKLSLRL